MLPHIDNEESEFKIEVPERRKKAGGVSKNNKYSVISYQMRQKLISLASSKGYSISRAARELGIKVSTGKFIVKCFHDSGKIMKKPSVHLPKLTSNIPQSSDICSREQKDEKPTDNPVFDPILQVKVEPVVDKQQIPQNLFSNMFNPIIYYPYSLEQQSIQPLMMYYGIESSGGMMPCYFP